MIRKLSLYDFCIAAAWLAKRGHLPAIATEARRDETQNSGSVREGAGRKALPKGQHP